MAFHALAVDPSPLRLAIVTSGLSPRQSTPEPKSHKHLTADVSTWYRAPDRSIVIIPYTYKYSPRKQSQEIENCRVDTPTKTPTPQRDTAETTACACRANATHAQPLG